MHCMPKGGMRHPVRGRVPSFAKAVLSKLRFVEAKSPPSRRRGGCAIKKIVPFLNWRRRGGCSSVRLSKSVRENKRWLETTTPSAPFKGCFAAFLFRSRPPLLREGGDLTSPKHKG